MTDNAIDRIDAQVWRHLFAWCVDQVPPKVIMCRCDDWQTCAHPWPVLVDPMAPLRATLAAMDRA